MASTVNNNKDGRTSKIKFVQGKLFVKFENSTPYILNSLLAKFAYIVYYIYYDGSIELNDSFSFRSLW